jgi:hypothetical protein
LVALLGFNNGGSFAEISFDEEDGGVYLTTIDNAFAEGLGGQVQVSGTGDVVPAFMDVAPVFQGPLLQAPDLGALSTLSTSQDWSPQLTPSNSPCNDRVIIDSPDVGQILCELNDTGQSTTPALVVPAALLGNFSGHTGTVTIYRDDYELVDVGALVLGMRLGSGIRTETNSVTFTP